MKISRSELIKQYIDSFPVLPLTASRLMEVTSDPESSAENVVEAIQHDQSLSLTVLKIANSALFGRPKKVASLNLAVVTLGFDEVYRIALTKALINSFGKIPEQKKFFIDKFWEHSFVCAMVAKRIAQSQYIAPDIAFMGGLLHDVGKLIMFQTFSGDYDPFLWMASPSSEANMLDELRQFSFTHDMIGGRLLDKWLFPDSLLAAVSNHHHPHEAPREKQGLAFIIQLADLLAFYSCNPGWLGEEDILTAIRTAAPDIQSGWQDFGMPWDDEAVSKWFNWLQDNHGQGGNLKKAYAL